MFLLQFIFFPWLCRCTACWPWDPLPTFSCGWVFSLQAHLQNSYCSVIHQLMGDINLGLTEILIFYHDLLWVLPNILMVNRLQTLQCWIWSTGFSPSLPLRMSDQLPELVNLLGKKSSLELLEVLFSTPWAFEFLAKAGGFKGAFHLRVLT